MSHLTYQGSASIEVFSAAGSKPLEELKVTVPKAVKRQYDKGLKAACIVIEGDVAPSCRVSVPASTKATLGLKHPTVVLQLYAAPSAPLFFEFACTDGKTKRRIVMSTATHRPFSDPLHVKLPLGKGIPRGEWLNLCFDVMGIFSHAFGSVELKAIEAITVGPTCRLRKIVSLRDGVPSCQEDLPPHLDFAVGVAHRTLRVCLPPRAVSARKGPLQVPQLVFQKVPSVVEVEEEEEEVAQVAQVVASPAPRLSGETVESSVGYTSHGTTQAGSHSHSPRRSSPSEEYNPSAYRTVVAAVDTTELSVCSVGEVGEALRCAQRSVTASVQTTLHVDPRASADDITCDESRLHCELSTEELHESHGHGQHEEHDRHEHSEHRQHHGEHREHHGHHNYGYRGHRIQDEHREHRSHDEHREYEHHNHSGHHHAHRVHDHDHREHNSPHSHEHTHGLDRSETMTSTLSAGRAAAAVSPAQDTRRILPPQDSYGQGRDHMPFRVAAPASAAESEDSDNDTYGMQLLREIREMEMEITNSTREIEAGLQQHREETLLYEGEDAAVDASLGSCVPPAQAERSNVHRHQSSSNTAEPAAAEAVHSLDRSESEEATSTKGAHNDLSAAGLSVLSALPLSPASARSPLRSERLQHATEAGTAGTVDVNMTQPCDDSLRSPSLSRTSTSPHVPMPSEHSPQRSLRKKPDGTLSSVERKLMKVNLAHDSLPAASKHAVRRSLLGAMEGCEVVKEKPAAHHPHRQPSILAAQDVLRVDLPMPHPANSWEEEASTDTHISAPLCAVPPETLPPKGLTYSMSTYDGHSTSGTPVSANGRHRPRYSSRPLPTPTPQSDVKRGFHFNNSTLSEFSADLPTPAVRSARSQHDDSHDERCRGLGASSATALSALSGMSPFTGLRSARKSRDTRNAPSHTPTTRHAWDAGAHDTTDMDDVVVFDSNVLGNDGDSVLSDWSIPGQEEVDPSGPPDARMEAQQKDAGVDPGGGAGKAEAAAVPEADTSQPRTLLYDPSLHVYYDPTSNEYFAAD